MPTTALSQTVDDYISINISPLPHSDFTTANFGLFGREKIPLTTPGCGLVMSEDWRRLDVTWRDE